MKPPSPVTKRHPRSATKRGARTIAAALAFAAAGCSGLILEPPSTRETPPFTPPDGPRLQRQLVSSRLPRLTRRQWEASARATLALEGELGVYLEADNLQDAAYDTSEAHLAVTSGLAVQYRAAADALSTRVADDAAALERVLGTGVDASDPDHVRRALSQVLRRAFRRPLADEEVTAYLDLYRSAPAPEGSDSATRLREGTRIVLLAALQSPHFLYRIERGTGGGTTGADGVTFAPLSDWEYAARLSFAVLDGPPDATLMHDVEAGALRTDAGRRGVVRRMLGDARASQTLLRFHRALYGVDAYADMRKDEAMYPGTANLGRDTAIESERFLSWVLTERRGVRDLLTSRVSFVNRRLADIYGMPTEGMDDATFRRVELPATRPGILTRAGWTAWKADTVERRSVLRGVFVLRNVLCQPLGTPDETAFAQARARVPPPETVTNRGVISYQTEWGSCASCHQRQINPVGFAFENYDAVGRYVTTDHGQPIVAAGSIQLDGESLRFEAAAELIIGAAERPSAHACYARHAFEFLAGFPATGRDEAMAIELGARSAAEGLALASIIEEILVSESFRSIRTGAGGMQ